MDTNITMSININMIGMKRKYDRYFFSNFCVVVAVLIKSKEKRSLIAVLYIKSMDNQMLE